MLPLMTHLDFFRRLIEHRLASAFSELLGPAERYRLERKLGRGGMGEVWLAEDRKLGRRVAVKLMSGDATMNPGASARFEREIRATIGLRHPHTVRIYDHGVTVTGSRYYVMELLEGRNLAELMEDEGALKPTRAVELVRQAASALSEAHEHGIVHRDVKPRNFVVVSAGGQRDFLKVLDFGLAIGSDDLSLTADGICAGSPGYVSPEVITGEAADARSDIYALGCVLYTLLTGRPPFIGATAREVLLAHLHHVPEPPSHLSPHRVPKELDLLVLKCLAKNPAHRPGTAADFFDDLVYFLRVHASRVFRGAEAPRMVPSFHASEPVLTQIRMPSDLFDEAQRLAEEMPTSEQRRGRPPSYQRLYEQNLQVTKDVCIDDSVIEIDPDELTTHPEQDFAEYANTEWDGRSAA
jgi:serine/threonine-protein kinase